MKIITLILLLSQIGYADCTTSLKLCDLTVNIQKTLIDEQTAQIQNYQDKSALQESLINDQQAKLNSPLHNTLDVALTTTVIVLLLEITLGAFKK